MQHHNVCPNLSRTPRHDMVKHTIVEMLRCLGYSPQVEQYCGPAPCEDRDDIRFVMGTQHVMMDVTVVCTQTKLPPGTKKKPGAWTHVAAQKKIEDYKRVLEFERKEGRNTIFVPFAMDCWGGLDTLAYQLLCDVIVAAKKPDPNSELNYWITRLSVAVCEAQVTMFNHLLPSANV